MSSILTISPTPLVSYDTSLANKGLIIQVLEAGSVFSGQERIDFSLLSAGFTSVKIFYVKNAITTVNLKFTISRIASTVPSTPTVVEDDEYVAYTLSGSTGQINSLSVPVGLLTSFVGMARADVVGIGIERKSTDSGDFQIHHIEFEFDETVVATAYDIVTLTEVKEFLNIVGTSNDTFLSRWISYVSKQMESMEGINNKVRVQTITDEIRSGNGLSRVVPNFYPIYAIGANGASDAQKLASVQYRTDVDTAWADIETDLDHIVLNNPNLFEMNDQNPYSIELTATAFPVGLKNVKLTYQAGWEVIPAELTLVALEKVADLYKQSSKNDGRFGIESKSESEGGGNRNTRYKDFTERHERMMKPYRRRI